MIATDRDARGIDVVQVKARPKQMNHRPLSSRDSGQTVMGTHRDSPSPLAVLGDSRHGPGRRILVETSAVIERRTGIPRIDRYFVAWRLALWWRYIVEQSGLGFE